MAVRPGSCVIKAPSGADCVKSSISKMYINNVVMNTGALFPMISERNKFNGRTTGALFKLVSNR